MLTAFPDMGSAMKGIRLDVDDYIIKPSNTGELIACLTTLMLKREVKRKRHSLS